MNIERLLLKKSSIVNWEILHQLSQVATLLFRVSQYFDEVTILQRDLEQIADFFMKSHTTTRFGALLGKLMLFKQQHLRATTVRGYRA